MQYKISISSYAWKKNMQANKKLETLFKVARGHNPTNTRNIPDFGLQIYHLNV